VDVVIGPYIPAEHLLRERYAIINVGQFRRFASAYTAVIYQIANSFDHHEYMIPCMVSVPGITVLHDYCLQYLVLGLTLRQGRLDALREILEPTHGERAASLARALLFHRVDPNTISFARPFVDMSRGVIVHSEYARTCVMRDSPDAAVRVVPMGVPIDQHRTADTSDLRRRYGFGPDDFIVASASTISYTKRLTLLIEAVRDLRRHIPQMKLLIVGGGNLGQDAKALLETAELNGSAQHTGWVSDDAYRELIGLSDVVVDMRYPSGAETSASLARALAAGRPAIVSDQGTFTELPDSCCIKIAVDSEEGSALRQALQTLYEQPDRRLRMVRAAGDFARAHLRIEDAARRYWDAARDIAALPALATNGDAFAARMEGRRRRAVVRSVYALCRLTHLYQKYGIIDTLARVRQEVTPWLSGSSRSAVSKC